MTPAEIVAGLVKPLVWEDLEDQSIAAAPVGHYVADAYMGNGRVELIVGWPRSGMHVVWRHDNPRAGTDDLKAAAEADYAPRIAAALDVDKIVALVKALEPFKAMSGELFARNWNKDDVVIALDNPGDPRRLTFGDFLDLHAALAAFRGAA